MREEEEEETLFDQEGLLGSGKKSSLDWEWFQRFTKTLALSLSFFALVSTQIIITTFRDVSFLRFYRFSGISKSDFGKTAKSGQKEEKKKKKKKKEVCLKEDRKKTKSALVEDHGHEAQQSR